jgi:hypothetical protein
VVIFEGGFFFLRVQLFSLLCIEKNSMIKKGSSVFFTLRPKRTRVGEDDLEVGTLLFDTGRYEGQIQSGKANGKGMFIWKDGSKYNGEWKDNYRHGRGVYLCTDGTKVIP